MKDIMRDVQGKPVNKYDKIIYPRKTSDGNLFLAIGTAMNIDTKNLTVTVNAYTKPLTRHQICVIE